MSTTPESPKLSHNHFQIQVPGKTFLLGEYLALSGGPAILASTPPYFLLEVDIGDGLLGGIHADSPAGLYWGELVDTEGDLRSQEGHEDLSDSSFPIFSGLNLKFEDPHEGAGGLGASSAQFAALYALFFKMQYGKDFSGGQGLDLNHLLSVYRRYSWNGEGVPPSGYDLISQFMGGLSQISESSNEAQNLAWNFSDLSFCLIRTGVKLATHEHLRKQETLAYSELHQIVSAGQNALISGNSKAFSDSVRAYCECLDGQGLLAPSSRALIGQMYDSGLIQSAKGCGAMGADIILAIVENSDKSQFVKWLENNKLKIIGSSDDLAHGLTFNFD